MSLNPLEGLKAAENSSEPAVGHTIDDASTRLVGPDTQRSSNNSHTRDDFFLKAIDAGQTNNEAWPRPVVRDATKDSAPSISTGPDIASESLQLLKKIHQTLKDSTIAQESGTGDTSHFWAAYKRHAEEYDSEFFEKYKDDMDIVLIFAGLFSAVSTSFISAMQPSLSPDPTDTTNALLMQVVHALNNTAFAGQNLEPPIWNGPGSTMIWVQSLIHASLSVNLLVAIGAMLGKRWLGQYRQKGMGMNDERGRRRQKKLDGLRAWYFHVALEALFVLLQISLLMFSVALSAYVWTQQFTVGVVVISITALSVLFYILVSATSMISPSCPFQTPLSTALSGLWQCVHRITTPARTATVNTMLQTHMGQELNAIFVPSFDAGQEPYRLGISKASDGGCSRFDDYWGEMSRGRARVSADTESLSGSMSMSPPDGPLKLDIPSHPSVHDAPSVKWLLETSSNPDIITVAARNVPEVEWPAALDLSPVVAQLRNIFEGCFVYKNDLKTWQLAPSSRERALACGKALVYLDCEKSYSSTEQWGAGNHIFPFHRRVRLRLRELFAVLWSVDEECKCASQIFFIHQHIMGDRDPCHDTFRVSLSGLQGGWSFHLLPRLLSSPQCPDHIKSEAAKEIAKRLSPTNLPSPRILADCLLSVAVLVGVPIDREVFAKVNKSLATQSLLRLLLEHLSSARGVDWRSEHHPVRCLFPPLARLWEYERMRPQLFPCKSRQCCCAAVGWSLQICISLVQKAKALGPTTDKKEPQELWGDARAVLHFSAVASSRDHPAYGGHCGRPAIDDFAWALDFLDYHYEARDEIAVADTFFMLSQARNIAMWAKSPKFVEAIIFAMQSDKSTRVRHSALHTAWEIRIALGSPDDAIGPLLHKFAAALLSAILTDMHPANQTKNDDSPDRSIHDERDLQYLQILYTFAQNKDGVWDELLRSEGHLQRCIDMAQHISTSKLSVYLVAMVWTFESREAERRFLDDFNPALTASHLSKAWDALRRGTFTFAPKIGGSQTPVDELEETLPALMAFTRRFLETNPGSPNYVPNVQSVLGKLRKCRPNSPMIREMGDLVEWLEARKNSGSEVR